MIATCIIRRNFSHSKTPPDWREKLAYVKQMKPYFIPFLHHNKQVTHSLLKSYGLLAMSKICFFGGPFFLKKGINSLAAVSVIDPLAMFFAFGVCYSGSILFESMRNLETIQIINLAIVQTTSKAYKHMLSLGPDFYFSGSQRHILFNLYKAQSAFEQNLRSFTQYFVPIVTDITLSVLLLLYYSNSIFAASFVLCYGSYSYFTVKYSDWRRAGIKRFRESQKNLDFITSETFANYYNVKYFQKQEQELLKYRDAMRQYYDRHYEVHKSLGVLNTVQRVIFGSGLTFNMMLAAHYVQKGLMTTGDIIMIQTLMMQFLSPLFILGSMYRGFEDNLIDIRKITSVMLTPASVAQGEDTLPEIKGNITFNHVSFKYVKDSQDLITNLSFSVAENQFVAIVGRSGIGKTTILNLIFRLYDPHSGEVLLDGTNIKKLNFDFRSSMSVVSQSPYLFNGTVMENLKFGNPNAGDEEVMLLAQRLNMHHIINQLPNQYNHNVGQKGNIFSGGEKQRISLIRALLKKSKIMLLDEPTSSVDSQTEQIIGQILKEQKCTKILITHREGLLHFCDDIVKIAH